MSCYVADNQSEGALGRRNIRRAKRKTLSNSVESCPVCDATRVCVRLAARGRTAHFRPAPKLMHGSGSRSRFGLPPSAPLAGYRMCVKIGFTGPDPDTRPTVCVFPVPGAIYLICRRDPAATHALAAGAPHTATPGAPGRARQIRPGRCPSARTQERHRKDPSHHTTCLAHGIDLRSYGTAVHSGT